MSNKPLEVSSRVARLSAMMGALKRSLAIRRSAPGLRSARYWRANGRRHVALYAAPIAVDEPLHRLFFEPNWATIMTSATLTADRRFDLLLSRTGGFHETTKPSRWRFRRPLTMRAKPSWV